MPNITGWNGNHQIFRDLITEIRPTNIIEVGSWHGQSAITMALIVKELALNTTIYCVDTWLGALEFMNSKANPTTPVDSSRGLEFVDGYPGVYYTFLKNIRHFDVEGIIVPVPQTAHIAAKWFRREGITADLIYLDGSHEYQDVTNDIIDYYPLATHTLFGDDYNNRDYEVTQAVNDTVTISKLGALEIVDNNFWVLKKPYEQISKTN